MVRLPKVLYIPLLGTSVCKMFSDRVGTGVKNLGCCHQETPFLFNSSELLCVQHSARHFSGEQRRGQEGYKTNFQPTESFHIRNRTLFHINKALWGTTCLTGSLFAVCYFLKALWTNGNNSRVVERHSGIFKEDSAAIRGGCFVSMWRRVGFQRRLAKIHPSLLVHVTAWRLPKIMMIYFLVCLLQLFAHHPLPFLIVRSQAWGMCMGEGVCVCTYFLC